MDPTTQNENPVTPPQSPPPAARSNKKLIYGVVAGVVVLLVVLIALVVALLMKKDDTDTTSNTDTNSSEQSGSDSSDEKSIVKRVATDNDAFEVLIYAPRQTGSNTTINYGIHNKCDDCEDKKFGSIFSLFGYSTITADAAYLLDEENGTRYSTIVDADKKPLATKSCSGSIEPGKTLDCFVAFTKVPSGTTVSVVLGNTKIDDISIK